MIVLMVEDGERLVLFQEVIDDDFGESGIWHVFTETLVDYNCQSSPWLVHVIHKHVGVLVQQTLIAKINKKCGVLDEINDYLKCLFLLWHSGFKPDIGRANLDSLRDWNPFIITSSNLLFFLRIHDAA
ncbi:hypothetical protein Tco_1426422 [Tanacetum coccineum]